MIFLTHASERYVPGAYVLSRQFAKFTDIPLHVYSPLAPQFGGVVWHQSSYDFPTIEAVRSDLLLRQSGRVFWLGADCYPVADPSSVFAATAAFWEDAPSGDAWRPDAFPPGDLGFTVQGDVMTIDVDACREQIETVHRYNCDPDRYYPGNSRDQSCFRAAFAGVPITRYPQVDWQTIPHVFLHNDFAGRTLIVHRLGSKWPAVFSRLPEYLPICPGEADAWTHYQEFTGVRRD